MKRTLLLLFVAMFFLPASSSYALLITQTDTLGISGSHDYYPPGWVDVYAGSSFTVGSHSDTLQFSQFDSSLGTLNSVTVSIASDIGVTMEVWQGVYGLTATYNFDSNYARASAEGILAQAGASQLITHVGQNSRTSHAALAASDDTTALSGLSGFIGTGLVDVNRSAAVRISNPAPYGVDLLYYNYSGTVTATLTYDYDLTSVSEPATLLMLGIGLVGLGLAQVKRSG